MATVKSTDPNSPDFMKIDTASEAAGAGVDVGVTTDYQGTTFPTPPDIGAFASEAGSVSAQATGTIATNRQRIVSWARAR